jgi:hypothetical protein
MTDLEHADISRRLALAIGWAEQDVKNVDGVTKIRRYYIFIGRETASEYWQVFDFTSPAVIWPIAERFNAFPWVYSKNRWHANVDDSGPVQMADTAALAVALAVIKAKEQQ